VNAPGVLLDTGPLVALLSRRDAHHAKARQALADCTAPFRCCEAVLAEACFLMSKVDADGPAEVLTLGRRGLYTIALGVQDEAEALESLLRKYANRPMSLADACLVRLAEIHDEPRILTFNDDFDVYRWAGRRKFERL
jgi:predicted nucleic acid-binding protein